MALLPPDIGNDDRHSTATGNLYMLLRAYLHGSPYRVYMNDVAVHIEPSDTYLCPDVFVTCSPRDAADRHVKREPLLIAEVLSPASAGYDRGGKFASYRQLPSLQEYLLIDPAACTLDLFRKSADGLWVLHPQQLPDTLVLACIDAHFPVAVLLDDLDGDTAVTESDSDEDDEYDEAYA